MSQNQNIFIFGDSITWGAWDENGGWAEHLRRDIQNRTMTEPDFTGLSYNFGICGNTAEDVLARFENDIAPRLTDNSDNIFIFAIGTNDSQYYLDNDTPRYTEDDFAENIRGLITAARKHHAIDITFVGLTPVDEDMMNPIPQFPTIGYINTHIKKMNDVLVRTCQAEGVTCVDIYERWEQQDYKAMLSDGLHPNAKGHADIHQAVQCVFQENIAPTQNAKTSTQARKHQKTFRP